MRTLARLPWASLALGLALALSGCRGVRSEPTVAASELEAQAAPPAPTVDAYVAARLTTADDDLRALRIALGFSDLEAVRRLLDRGVDPDAVQADGTPVVRWLASGRHLKDDDALAVATLLADHHCNFGDRDGGRGPSLLVNLAPRRLPRTLQFVASRTGPHESSVALDAIAGSDDLESVKILLASGADPLWGPGGLRSAMFDAASRGRAPSVAEMLRHVQDLGDPKVVAAFRAVRATDSQTRKAFLDAGVKPPPSLTPPPPTPHELPPDITLAMTRLGLSTQAGSTSCWELGRCGDVVLVDCNAAADGPEYYIDIKVPKLLSTCGGACMKGCTNCPPGEWTCARHP